MRLPRLFTLFRALFPSWRFFEEAVALPELFMRWRSQDSDYSDWHIVVPQAARPRGFWMFNPHGNLALAYHTLMEQASSDLGDFTGIGEGFEAHPSFQLLERLAHMHGRGDFFQFKLSSVGRDASIDDLLISREYERDRRWN